MDIKPYEKNAKIHNDKQLELLAKIVAEVGWRQNVEINQQGVIVAGHGRWLAYQKYKDKYNLPEVWVMDDTGKTIMGKHATEPLTERQERMWRLADNQVNAMTGVDMDLAIPELKLLDDDMLSLTGFDKDLIIEPDEKDDEVPEVPEESVSQLGDLYELGGHRVLCGDSTKIEDVERLMDGKKADMVFTDPPYLMAFEGGINEKGEKSKTGASHEIIKNDKLSKEDGDKFLFDLSVSIRLICTGAWYITFYRLGIDRLFNALARGNLKWRNMIIWKKNNHNLSNSDYKSLYEPMIMGYDDDFIPIFYGWNDSHNWAGRKNEKDVWEVKIPSIWEVDKTKKNDLHPTMKPVELSTRAILNSSKVGNIVGDIFLGGGSTLISCEKTNRRCYGMELDPKYVDVIVQRYVDYTGNNKIKLNGKEIIWQT